MFAAERAGIVWARDGAWAQRVGRSRTRRRRLGRSRGVAGRACSLELETNAAAVDPQAVGVEHSDTEEGGFAFAVAVDPDLHGVAQAARGLEHAWTESEPVIGFVVDQVDVRGASGVSPGALLSDRGADLPEGLAEVES